MTVEAKEKCSALREPKWKKVEGLTQSKTIVEEEVEKEEGAEG